MRYIECDRCGKRVTEELVHVLQMELINAVPTAPEKHTKRQGDYCPRCAAQLFRAFKERYADEAKAA